MDVSFEAFKVALKQLLDVETSWKILEETEKSYVINYREEDYQHHYAWCEDMTNEFYRILGIPCLVYRKQLLENGQLKMETYEAACYYEEQFLRLLITTKENDTVSRLHAKWTKLYQGWYVLCEIKEPVGLQVARETVMNAIQELPEFRLYAVTGMI